MVKRKRKEKDWDSMTYDERQRAVNREMGKQIKKNLAKSKKKK